MVILNNTILNSWEISQRRQFRPPPPSKWCKIFHREKGVEFFFDQKHRFEPSVIFVHFFFFFFLKLSDSSRFLTKKNLCAKSHFDTDDFYKKLDHHKKHMYKYSKKYINNEDEIQGSGFSVQFSETATNLPFNIILTMYFPGRLSCL